jgi:hypothetical protein
MTDLNDAGCASGYMLTFVAPSQVLVPVRWDSTGASHTINNNNVVAGVSSLGVHFGDLTVSPRS